MCCMRRDQGLVTRHVEGVTGATSSLNGSDSTGPDNVLCHSQIFF